MAKADARKCQSKEHQVACRYLNDKARDILSQTGVALHVERVTGQIFVVLILNTAASPWPGSKSNPVPSAGGAGLNRNECSSRPLTELGRESQLEPRASSYATKILRIENINRNGALRFLGGSQESLAYKLWPPPPGMMHVCAGAVRRPGNFYVDFEARTWQ
ncbi:hypothetical protein FIBSPDRAFT_893743 [Athelia psychrophila]|uniref:Uncharacterized protein n=1 Tax=Athelia psychrophila TaxID=1759441 RepID=A0A166GNG6_9AGAM|nr:hypothetical protein FIBSPDRAFT_893743 [Fibularhizoctonia sp. CBS 109695]